MRAGTVKARADVVILAMDRKIGCDVFLGTAKEDEIVRLAFSNYVYCLRDANASYPSRLTLGDFAAKIEQQFNCQNNLRNRVVVDTLRQVHERMVQAEAAGKMIVIGG